MNCHTPTLDRNPVFIDQWKSLHLVPMPQWHIVMCRARWLVTPQPSDAPADPESGPIRWLGPAKVLLWTAVSIGVGLLMGGLN